MFFLSSGVDFCLSCFAAPLAVDLKIENVFLSSVVDLLELLCSASSG
jgi:hypothetical protein